MKNSKISKIMGIGLTIALLTSLLAVATPASAGTLTWSAELGPSTATTTNTIVTGSDVNDIAVSAGGGTVLAVSSPSKLVFKSTNGGTTWSRLTVTANATQIPAMVALAPG